MKEFENTKLTGMNIFEAWDQEEQHNVLWIRNAKESEMLEDQEHVRKTTSEKYRPTVACLDDDDDDQGYYNSKASRLIQQ